MDVPSAPANYLKAIRTQACTMRGSSEPVCVCGSEGSMTCMQAAQPQAAEPSGLADSAQANTSAEAVHNAVGPDEHILQELDLAKAKPCLTRVCSALCAST